MKGKGFSYNIWQKRPRLAPQADIRKIIAYYPAVLLAASILQACKYLLVLPVHLHVQE